jgi:Ca2+-binding RTX toxin-like protein
MAAYFFETITAGQALAFTAATDALVFSNRTSSGAQMSVVYNPAVAGADPTVTITDLVTRRIVVFGATAGGAGILGEGGPPGQQVSFPDGSNVFIGGGGAENVTGTEFGDGLFGGLGDDTLSAGAGHDLVQGNQGSDQLDGGAGDDTIFGGQGDDRIVTGAGSNSANGNLGADTITGAEGSSNTLLGGQQNDLLVGGSGADFLNGNLGDDTVVGGGGADILLGEAGMDSISAGDDASNLAGGAGGDTLQGGAGADTLDGGSGADILRGAGGGDLFRFASSDSSTSADAADRILDWTGGAPGAPADHIQFAGLPPVVRLNYLELSAGDFGTARALGNLHISSGYDYVAVQVGADVVVFVDSANNNGAADDAVILVGRSLADIDFTNISN